MASVPERRSPRLALGSLNVHLVRAILPKMDSSGGGSDPYVVLSMNTQTFKTDKQKGTRTPNWDLQFRFDVGTQTDVLKVQCFDWDRFSKNDLIGEAEIPYEQFRRDLKKGADSENPGSSNPDAPAERWISLQKDGKKADSRGRILLKFEFVDHRVQKGDLFPKQKANPLLSSRSTFVEGAPAKMSPTPRNSLADTSVHMRQRGASMTQNEGHVNEHLAAVKENSLFDTSTLDNQTLTPTIATPTPMEAPPGEEKRHGDKRAITADRVATGGDKSAEEISRAIKSDLKKKLKAVCNEPDTDDDDDDTTDSDYDPAEDEAAIAAMAEEDDKVDLSDISGITEGYSDTGDEDSDLGHVSEGSSLEDELSHLARRLSHAHIHHHHHHHHGKTPKKLTMKKAIGKMQKARRKAKAFSQRSKSKSGKGKVQGISYEAIAQTACDAAAALKSAAESSAEWLKKSGAPEVVCSPHFIAGAAVTSAAALLIFWRSGASSKIKSAK